MCRELWPEDSCADKREKCRSNCMSVGGPDVSSCLLECYKKSNECNLK